MAVAAALNKADSMFGGPAVEGGRKNFVAVVEAAMPRNAHSVCWDLRVVDRLEAQMRADGDEDSN